MKRAAGLSMAAVLLISAAPIMTGGILVDEDKHLLDYANSRIQGLIVDYTRNSGQDLRIFSPALGKPMDMYVYLPPHYDPRKYYPLVILLHGVLEDERGFLRHGVDQLDQAIVCGQLPPMIIAVPDGSLDQPPHLFKLDPENCQKSLDPSIKHRLFQTGSFFINGPAGNYQDWIVEDVWNFVTSQYRIRPERAAHVIAGGSMGGFGAFNIGIKHRERFQIVMGILPVLNLRWVDCHGNYRGKFNPGCWGWRDTPPNPHEVIGSFFGGLIKIRMKDLIIPVFGDGWEGLQRASEENPIELVDRLNLKDGELDMYVAYAGRDEFNLDAQAESFIYFCQMRGITLTVDYDPKGTHSVETALKMAPHLIAWLGERLRAHGIDGPTEK